MARLAGWQPGHARVRRGCLPALPAGALDRLAARIHTGCQGAGAEFVRRTRRGNNFDTLLHQQPSHCHDVGSDLFVYYEQPSVTDSISFFVAVLTNLFVRNGGCVNPINIVQA